MRPLGVIVVEDAVPPHVGTSRPRIAALEQIANRPIAEHVIDALASACVQEIVVVAPIQGADDIRSCLESSCDRHRLRTTLVEAPGLSGVSGGLRLAAPIVGDAPCIVHLASGLLGEPLTRFVDNLQPDSPDVTLIFHQRPASCEHLSAATQDILRIAELDPERAPLGMAGVLLFGPGALDAASDVAWYVGGEVDLTTVARRIDAKGGSLQVRLVDTWRTYRGDPADLLELNQIALDRLQSEQRSSSNHGNRIEGRVQIHRTASVRDSMIVGPVVIGPGARVAEAYIGPYTSIGEDAQIEGAEIERSIIGTGASIMHIGGRLAGSLVGRDARVFRDFSLPRALRLRVGEGTEVAFC